MNTDKSVLKNETEYETPVFEVGRPRSGTGRV